MGRIIIGTPSAFDIKISRLATLLMIVFIIVLIWRLNSPAHYYSVIRHMPAKSSYIEAIKYLEKRPYGKHSKEVVDTLISYYSTIPTYYSSLNNYKSNIPRFEAMKETLSSSSIAQNALDSLIQSRVLLEYEKAELRNCDEGWDLFRAIIPEKYWGDVPK